MQQLIYILLNISVPILILIAIGYGFQKAFKGDRNVLTKLLIYFVLPATFFAKIINSDITWSLVLRIAVFIMLLTLSMLLLSLVLVMLLRYSKSRRNALGNALMFMNSGNYGLPLIELSFGGNPLSSSTQLIVAVFGSLIRNTVGVFRASTGNSTTKKALRNVIKMPVLYAIAFAFILKSLYVTVPQPIMIPLEHISDSFVALALISLGTQLPGVQISNNIFGVLLATFVRIALSPLIAFSLVLLLGFDGLLAQTLIVGAAAPTAVNTVHIAREFDNEPGFAAQMVLSTTVFCTFSLPLVIWFVGWYF